MSVTGSTAFDAQDVTSEYVAFRGIDRSRGACGTLSMHVETTGNVSGGTVTLSFTARTDMHGFHGLYVPRVINATDDQAANTSVLLSLTATGNERVVSDFELAERTKKTVGTDHFTSWSVDEYALVFEPNQATLTPVAQLKWAANVDTKVYHGRMYCVVYDLEALSKRGNWVPDSVFLNS